MGQRKSQILFWSAYSRVYDGLLKLRPYADLIDQAVGALSVEADAIVVDLGCGTGNCLKAVLGQYAEAPTELVGVDSSPQMLRVANRKLDSDQRIVLVKSSLLDWLEERSSLSVDNIISVNVLYTMGPAERERFWSGIASVLKERGRAVIVTTDRPGFGPVVREHFRQVPIWRAFPPRLVAVMLMNLVIWAFESNQTYDTASAEKLVAEARSAGLVVEQTRRCYGGESRGVDVMLVVHKL